MARWTAKEMVLNIASTKEAILFLEALQKQIKIVDIIADYYPGKITIRFEGVKEKLMDALEITKNLHQMIYAMLYPNNSNYYEYNITQLSKMTGKTFPIQILLNVLEFQGYKAFKEEEAFLSTIDYDKLINVITLIDQTLTNMPYEVSTSSLRDVIATIAVAQGITNEEAISKARKIKIVEEDDLQRLKLSIAPDQALEKSLKLNVITEKN
ncbi:MAG TPA: DUF2067 family protein [candidate division Zixibacteria bacterium]|nr:DUF2067 family protein [candidate division Zixibacteria bacterium]